MLRILDLSTMTVSRAPVGAPSAPTVAGYVKRDQRGIAPHLRVSKRKRGR